LVLHDLNTPIHAHLQDTADFILILDGSTFDNLFSPSTALQSVAPFAPRQADGAGRKLGGSGFQDGGSGFRDNGGKAGGR
jgi:uncharacterized membrane protein YgcG